MLAAALTVLAAGGLNAGSAHVLQQYNEVDFRVRGVGLGSGLTAVVRKFGKPKSRKQEKITDDTCSPPHSVLTLTYEGITFELDGDLRGRGFEVVSIEATTPELLITPGIRIGMNEKQVRFKLQTPQEENDEGGMHRLFYVTRGNDGGASLYFRNGKVVKVFWTYTLC